jgi:hypothetical protein
MRRTHTRSAAERFADLDLHDDGLISVSIRLRSRKTSFATIELAFRDDSNGDTKLLSFESCANVRHIMDFDVMEDNRFAQTERTSSTIDTERMKKLILTQRRHWHVKYMPPGPQDKPVKGKLASIKKYTLFRITFFGGTIEILAKDFTIRVVEQS